MSKGLSLWFACSSIALLMATAIAISYNAWLAILFGLLSIFNMGAGFIVKARLRRKEQAASTSA
ncbi:DUF5325 family protein [Paenibacillus taiwanensis]|uniref:DUF5325 family protein n=1 Tax=Paenibacillus taiwanensis TaxID=401638 RepID=UPI0004048DF7|nr:DUF5325 family protein [Paenibacillus taiwanensis]